MKLAYFCSSISWGGLEMNHLKDASWMKERGHEVLVLCVKDSPLEKEALLRELPIILVEKQKKYYDFKKARLVVELLRKEKVSHFIVRSTSDMSLAATVKYKMKGGIHVSYFMAMQLGVKKTNLLHTIRFNYIDLWVCPLNWLEKQVHGMTRFKNQTIVIPSGIDLSEYSELKSKNEWRELLDIPNGKLTFGIIGRFALPKGQLLLVEAMKKCRSKDFNVVFVGEPTKGEGEGYFNQMKAIISDEKLEGRVLIRPFRADTAAFYKAIDWMVMATKAETFGMVTIESLASGTPVLGSNAGGTPELLEQDKGGVLFETFNSDDLASKIDKICTGEVSINKEKLIEMARQYDHHLICEKVEKVLKLKIN